MVQSRRRSSLLGILALLAGASALVLTRFNPTGIQTVPNLPINLSLSAAAAIGATAMAVIALLAAASSRRTSTGVPLFAVLVGGAAMLLAFKPHLLNRPSAPAPAKAAPAPSGSVQASSPADSGEGHRVKTIFDSDYPSSTPDAKPMVAHPAPPDDSPVATTPPAARPDPAAALRAARTNVEMARENLVRSIEPSAAYRAAKSDADTADADLKKARLSYDPGSPELVAASRAALEARNRLQKLVDDAAAHDPAFQEASRQLKAAQSVK